MYNHKEIEQKWQKYWEENKTFRVENDFSKPKYYTLDMFPYPSGAGLHVGHPEGMTANDIVARYKNATGHNVLHPMGWDAFGLPAENYAIKTGTHPRITTDENIATFKRQIKELGFSYDWDREIDTTDPAYYKWTQWIFLKLFEKGLAYEQDLPINYCPSCKTGLANEEVNNDFTCERCGTKVEKKKIRQWVLAITKYADRLLDDVDRLDWPEGIKDMQRNWIGKSEGCEFTLKKASPHSVSPNGREEATEGVSISVYTTRIDTVFGMTYAVMAPDHSDIENFITDEYREKCDEYIKKSAQISDQDRTADNKEKTGVFTGSYVINPFNSEKIPVWIGDYVLGNYGTGAIMAVPAHDERDFAFAKRYGLDIRQSVAQMVGNYDSSFTQRNSSLGIIQNNNGEILLEYCNDSQVYKLPGGGIKEGESIEDALCREIQEETGMVDFKVEKLIKNIHTSYFSGRRKKNLNSFRNISTVKMLSNEVVKRKLDIEEDIVHEWYTKEETLDKLGLQKRSKANLGEYVVFEQWLRGEKATTDYGILTNSGEFTGLESKEAQTKLIEFAEDQGFGTKKVNYKLRDWLFSRQRYWGEPIPLVHCEECGIVGEKEENLPILLPETENFEPSGDGTSPLTQIESFVNCECPKCGGPGKRETNTMPQWGGSCWYYLRFMDPKNSEKLVDPEVAKYWGEVDSYVGGAEHAVLHLLYARFWHKFLFDIGVVPTDEPFGKLRNQGMILAHAFEKKNGGLLANDLVEEKDGLFYEIASGEEVNRIVSKMSKSLKNVVNPDEIVNEYGADSLRLYEMYICDFKDTAPWDTKNIIGVRRFLEKSERLFTPEAKISTSSDDETTRLLHKSIKKIVEDIENYKFNTAIAALMILVNNGLPQDSGLQQNWKEIFCILLNPFAPHLAEELWERINMTSQSIHYAPWPIHDEKLVVDASVKIGVQVLGKLRGTIEISVDDSKEVVLEKAKLEKNVAKWIEGKNLVKEIYVPGKIVNLVVK